MKPILKQLRLFEILFSITNATLLITFFFHLLLMFLMPSFVLRTYEDIYLIHAHIPRLIKLTMFIKKLAEKHQSISSAQGGFKMIPIRKRNRLFLEEIKFCVFICFLFTGYN